MLKQIVKNQCIKKINQLNVYSKVNRPKEGWIRTLRKALGMSGPQLAVRLGVSKSQASQMERMEMEYRITLKQLRRVADELDCDLSYALIPRQPVNDMLRARAELKAAKRVNEADVQMTLEAQKLSKEQLQAQFRLEVDHLLKELPRDLWKD
ncbi:MAG: mobile mystery protein A [Methylococcales symbiont of Iophon sp. n. MRB-2018]|nr:MAG: mobile mystery protein A [Methylococcales symbiont of Iophon sp. n. MRB-2018]